MRIIQTQQDIDSLQHSSLSPSFLKHIQEYFTQFRNSFHDQDDPYFSLQPSGPIFILEAGDNLHDLTLVGFRREDDGLFGICPEYVELYDLGNTQIYKIAVMNTNDYIITLFTQVGIHHKEAEQWLKEQAEV
ncbi:hypothetical protein [Paenibacillus polymyxa]|uniref:hypothetical protein n=1 Tax=Paenibacillus polymyxa TaxID=1406 RepID=UPI0006574CD1|nr:hypothetical protein [Paenibacillus polymyxa]KAF6627795.1 hypothetical protein H6F38_21930 [Paenibacillus sp. EKM208P]WPQ57143.1 hypothetical protein SKN87_01190 [Paenibacillus polymyxa]